jgi:hypothetical protein
MKRHPKSALIALLAVAAGLVLGIGTADGQEAKPAQDLKAKYAPILGAYQFDLTSLGMGILRADFYIENDTLYSKVETSDEPASMTPVEGKEFTFTISDPDEGLYTLEFQKDEKGEYTKCHVVNTAMGLDAVGTKIIKST